MGEPRGRDIEIEASTSFLNRGQNVGHITCTPRQDPPPDGHQPSVYPAPWQ